ncbi:MAG TPA: alpha/beta hydrolase [Bacteroidales bacterium]|nr:MAG: alpha/beta hydrolase [Bacteroidetes bacterium GWE2_42_24]OFY25897.1 MAG: alpha/beta hydrolase [Bacteroidetes bacterium GWF2_43_11]HBZ67575.1 alpha/beta hydrolase [Bacteroidales bacterium]
MVYNVLDIANKILVQPLKSEGDELITNMKLQKLLYYMQGFHLALFDGNPLFDEEIEAWMYGPVVPSMYRHFSKYTNNGIKPDVLLDQVISLTNDEEALFKEVFRVYGAYSAIGLMQLTHSEEPWSSVSTGQGSIITKDVMTSFFKTRFK